MKGLYVCATVLGLIPTAALATEAAPKGGVWLKCAVTVRLLPREISLDPDDVYFVIDNKAARILRLCRR